MIDTNQNVARPVAGAVRCGVLFGGFNNQFGWAFLGFGMIFVWIFIPAIDFGFWRHWFTKPTTTMATIVDSSPTSFSESSGRRLTQRNGQPIYAHRFVFRINKTGPQFEGVSYSKSKRKPGDGVMVEFPPARPELARIKGMSSAPIPIWAVFVLIFPAFGLAMITTGLISGARNLRLLRRGQVALGKFVRKKATRTEIDGKRVYALTFEFQDSARQTCQTVVRSHETKRLLDESRERLLFDPRKPSRAVLLDSLPLQARFDDTGAIRCIGRQWHVLILPLITVIGNAAWICFAYLT